MEWITRLNQAVSYIEEHLAEEIDYGELAKIACCSTYHFQRMFAYLADAPLGEYIRRRVNEAVPGCKNAFIEKDKAKTPKKVGVEHASRADLEEALKHCYIHAEQPHAHIGMDQMLDLGLQGKADSAQRRAFLGTYYHLGRPNAKTLLRRLNMLGVQADEVKKVLSEGGFS